MSDNCNSCHVTFTDDTSPVAIAGSSSDPTTPTFTNDLVDRVISIGSECCCGGSEATGFIIFDGTYIFDGSILFDAGVPA